MKRTIGFIVNPIAGMGGRVGLKGTDGVLKEAKARKAKPVAPQKARETLKEVALQKKNKDIHWITCADAMGEKELRIAGIKNINIVYTSKNKETSSQDTKDACKQFLVKNVDLILFCGGDGTARDIFEIVQNKIPILGIPSGVKMHSGVFGVTTHAAAKMIEDFVQGNVPVGDCEIMDLDEDLYRKGIWKVQLYGVAKGIIEPTYVQVGKTSFESVSDNDSKNELADHILEEMQRNPTTLFLFGPGGTIDAIVKNLGLAHTLLGIDAVYEKKVIGSDLNEEQILKLLKQYPRVKLVLSPIGAQGFILGRGNLQLSPTVVKKIKIDNIIVVATPSKLTGTPFLRVDTGDKTLDSLFAKKEFLMVVIGYRFSRVVKIQTNNF